MKKASSLLRLVVFLFLGLILFESNPLKAYSPIIASCSNDVLHPAKIIYVNEHDVQQLFEVRLDHYYLDAVAVRVKSVNQFNPATISVIKRDQGVIASVTQMIPIAETWVYADLNNVPIPRGVYLLKVESSPFEQVGWKYGFGTCIDDSHLILDGQMDLDKDMAFAVYAYDNSPRNNNSSNSSPAPNINQESQASNSSPTDQPSQISDTLPGETQESNDSLSDQINTPNNSPGSPSATSPLSSSQKSTASSGTNILDNLIPIIIIIIIIIAAPIVFVIWTIVINRKKKEPQKDQQKEKDNKKQKEDSKIRREKNG